MNLDSTTPPGAEHRICEQASRLLPLIALAAALVVVAWAVPACADPVKVTPTGNGLSFGTKIERMLNWGGQIALWASLASVLAGAGAWGLSKHFGSYGGAHKGMQLVLGGAIGALVVASADLIINSMFTG